MDGTQLSGWAAALFLALAFLYSLVTRREDMSKAAMQEALKPITAKLTEHSRQHGQHFAAEGSMASSVSSLSTRLDEHVKSDDARFQRIEEMHKEIREDIKGVLREISKR